MSSPASAVRRPAGVDVQLSLAAVAVMVGLVLWMAGALRPLITEEPADRPSVGKHSPSTPVAPQPPEDRHGQW